MALLVIIGWTVQLLIEGGMVFMTVMSDGLAAGIVAIYTVLCFLPNQVEKVIRQAARQRVATAPEEETVCLKPV